MSQFNLKTLLIAVLMVGASFELAKRLSWIQNDRNDQITGIGKPGRVLPSDYSEKNILQNRSRLQQNRSQFGVQPSAASSFKKALMIPAGSFDSNAGQAGANKKIVQANKKTADKNKDGDKKCRPKEDKAKAGVEFKFVQAKPVLPPESSLAKKPLDLNAQLAPESKTAKKEEELPECEDEKAEVAKEEKPADEDESKKEDDATAANPPSSTISGGLATNRNKGASLAGLEEWKARLLVTPNFKETVRLIEAAQSGQISSELFYTLVNLMLKDPREEMRELGVLSAGRTPSVQSFHLLVDVIQAEAFGTKLRQRAENEIEIYQQVSYLWVLENVMRSSDDATAVIWATRSLEDSARRFLSSKYNRTTTPTSTGTTSPGTTPGSGPGSTNPPTTAKNPYISTYNRFILILQELSRARGSAEQNAQARQTLSSLQALIRAVS